MGISDNFASVPKIFFPVFASLVLGTLFLIIGSSTPHWAESGTIHIGLWKYCLWNVCRSFPRVPLPDLIFRGLSTIAVLLSGVCCLAALAFALNKNSRRTLAILIAIGALLSFLANVIVDIWFGTGLTSRNSGRTQLGWSYVLSCLGSSSVFVACLLGFVMARNIRPNPALPLSGVVIYSPQVQMQAQGQAGPQYIDTATYK